MSLVFVRRFSFYVSTFSFVSTPAEGKGGFSFLFSSRSGGGKEFLWLGSVEEKLEEKKKTREVST